MKWLENSIPYQGGLLNTSIVMNLQQLLKLPAFILDPPLSTVFYGDFSKWCTSIIYFPIMLDIGEGKNRKLKLGANTTDLLCYGEVSIADEMGYTLGEYYYAPKYNDFRDYEPFSKCSIFLPYYGEVPINIIDVIGKYIQVRLNVDFKTGEAQYTIGVSETTVENANGHYIRTEDIFTHEVKYVDDSQTRVLNTYAFQLGTIIPYTATNNTERLFNISLATIGLVLQAGSLAYAIRNPNDGDRTRTLTYKERNPKTNRLIQTAQITDEVNEQSNVIKKASDILKLSKDCLTYFYESNSYTGKSGNPVLNCRSSTRPIILRKYCKMLTASDSYKKIYGLPLGQVKSMGACRGYTEVTGIHLEGTGFNNCTEREKTMIQNLLLSGVIFPDPT